MNDTKRSFKLITGSVIPVHNCKSVKLSLLREGRYLGEFPLQAAKKTFTQICRVLEIDHSCVLEFSIVETTRSSKSRGKIFTYTGERKMENIPKEVTKQTKNGPITYYIKYNNIITSLRE